MVLTRRQRETAASLPRDDLKKSPKKVVEKKPTQRTQNKRKPEKNLETVRDALIRGPGFMKDVKVVPNPYFQPKKKKNELLSAQEREMYEMPPRGFPHVTVDSSRNVYWNTKAREWGTGWTYHQPDTVSIRLQVVNSYDKSRAFCVRAFGVRFACLNGLVIGKKILPDLRVVHKDAEEFFKNPVKFGKEIKAYIEKVKEVTAVWNEWAKQEVTEEMLEELRETLADKEFIPLLEYVDEQVETFKKMCKRNPNKWDLFNFATAWTTRQSRLDLPLLRSGSRPEGCRHEQ
uniref:Uncharacterized protein n=1 Tax=Chromera velia CCMP2878 TaxID=1169474 RepID=A0A0G4H357_9ALVE|eukprot:Cvel_24440.t1-p1 / transcript=Cvel_24440.t1 / gene=Cvel_24440 / organism=Chromera_velia_CCMP2878 / gene_product=hypothetical protein / transcript_product=hypothetical protein / location=Cvel_scaffold2641:12354-13384(-) / protein_length=287 / sequence_SO=supercontig / SO=protein_coding / is_pseudo=false